MINITKLLNNISLIYGKSIDKDIRKLNQLVYSLSNLSDEEIKKKCLNKQINIKHKSILSFIMDRLPLIGKKSNDAIIEKLAIGVAAFNRCPADLSNTDELYPSQIKAALSLTQPCVLQMDTGEGKTYALLPAVFALSCEHSKVYILCANEYLALRDATRTKSYWDFVGLDVQFCSKSNSYNDSKWEGDVIYTTLTTLLFKGLLDDLDRVMDKRKLSFDAIIIDEVDAVLLDNFTTHRLTKEINSNVYNWEMAIEYARQIEEDVDITIDKEFLTASLTIVGNNRLKNYLNKNNIPKSQYGQLRSAIEVSFVSLSLEEDRDYVIHNNSIYSLNRFNGEIEYNSTENWIIPLEVIRGLIPRHHRIALHEINPGIFLKQFNHISGMSGTVKEDSAEYFYAYSLPIVMIKPRIKRQKKDLADVILAKNKEGIDAICQKVIQAFEEQRPVLVGTQNIKDAQLIYNLCCEKFADKEGVRLNLITGKDDKEIAEIYQHGGQVGSVIIATQLAGRGVDIRLSDEAKNNGGLALLGFQRGMDRRHDNQFLGRAGRQGDSYTALFILTMEGQIGQYMINDGKFRKFFTDQLNSEGLQSKAVTKGILRFQNRVRERNFLQRRTKDLIISTEKSVYDSIKTWFNCLNSDSTNSLPESFILFTIDHYIENKLNAILLRNLTSKQANNITHILSSSLNIRKESLINPVKIEGKTQEIVHKTIRDYIYNYTVDAISCKAKESAHKICLIGYIEKQFRYDFIHYRISRINNISNKPSNDNSYDYKFDKIVSSLNIQTINKESCEIHSLQINSASDIKRFYFMLNFLENNISFLSKDKYVKAIYIINSIDSYWFDSVENLRKKFFRINLRNSYSIAYWTIINSGMNIRDFKNKLSHDLQNEDLSIPQYSRLLSDGLTSEWDKIEGNLSISILRNVLTNPESLDELFFYEDNRASSSIKSSDKFEFANEWDRIKNRSSAAQQEKSNNLEQKLISDFVAQSEAKLGLGINFNKKSLQYLLEEFIAINPIYALNFPSKVIEAFEEWKRYEIRMGVEQERMIQNHKWIKLFLKFLSKRRIILMPSFSHKIKSVLKKAITNIKDYSIVFPIAQLALVVMVFVLFSIFGKWFRPLKYSSLGIALVDKFLCAGWLQKGIVTAPLFLLYVLSNHSIKENIIAKLAGSLGCSAFLVLLSIQSFSIGNILLALVFWIFLSIAYIKFIGFINYTKNALDLSLISVWLIFCISTVFLPSLNIVPSLVFIFVVMYYCFFHTKLNKEEILLMSSQIKGSYTNLETRPSEKAIQLEGNIKSVPHIYAFIFSGLVSSFIVYIPYPYYRYNVYVTILSYFVILLLLTKEIIKKKLSFSLWEESLNSKRQILIEKHSQGDIVELEVEKTLSMIKSKLLRKEILLQSLVFVCCVISLKGYQLFDFQYPLSLAVLFSAFLFGEHTTKFLKQMSQLLIFRGRITSEVFAFEKIRIKKENQTFIQNLQDFFSSFLRTRKFLNALFTVVFVLSVIVKTYNFLFK